MDVSFVEGSLFMMTFVWEVCVTVIVGLRGDQGRRRPLQVRQPGAQAKTGQVPPGSLERAQREWLVAAHTPTTATAAVDG